MGDNRRIDFTTKAGCLLLLNLNGMADSVVAIANYSRRVMVQMMVVEGIDEEWAARYVGGLLAQALCEHVPERVIRSPLPLTVDDVRRALMDVERRRSPRFPGGGMVTPNDPYGDALPDGDDK